MPFVHVRSLWATGSPCSGPSASPRATAASAASAPRRAASGQQRDDGVDGRIDLVDAREVGLHHLHGGELTVGNRAGEVGRRPGAEIGGRLHRGKLHRLPAPMVRLSVTLPIRFAGWLVLCAVLHAANATAQEEGNPGLSAPPVLQSAGVAGIRVEPFRNISRDPADDWIGKGIAATLDTDLAARGLALVGTLAGTRGLPADCRPDPAHRRAAWTPRPGTSSMPLRWTVRCPSCSRCRMR